MRGGGLYIRRHVHVFVLIVSWTYGGFVCGFVCVSFTWAPLWFRWKLLTNCDLSLLRGVSDKLSSLDWLLVARLQGPLNHKEGPHLR